MENDVKLQTGDDSLGEDNADILAAKRQRLAREKAAVSAGQLRAQMHSRPAAPMKASAVPTKTAVQRPQTAGTAPAAPRAAAAKQPTASGVSPAAAGTAYARPTAQRPVSGTSNAANRPAAGAQSPAARTAAVSTAASAQMVARASGGARTSGGARPTASAAARRPAQGGQTPPPAQGQPSRRPAQPPVSMGQTTRIPTVRPQPEKKAEPTAASLGGSAGIHTLIPHQQAAVSRKEPRSAEETRITDIRPAAPADATRISAVQPSVPKKKSPAKRREEEDESEGGNAILSVIKAITYIVAVIVVSVFLAVFIVLVGNDVYAFVKSDTVVEVTIPEYATLNDISVILHENGVIEYPTIFKIYANLQEKDNETEDGQLKESEKFLAGTYAVTPMMNYDELLAAFKPKKPTGTSRITIPEGYTTDQIIDLFVSKGIGTREGYVDVINNYDFDYWFIDELEENGWKGGRYYRLDGYLFPDTYEFYNASSEEVVIGKLLKRFNQVFVSDYAQKAKDLGYTVDELLTLASMIEKEGGTQSDFFNISSVFNNRLKNPGAYPYLESDATIVYAIEHETGEHITPTKEHTAYETPYNTYTNAGLPPGPIANPSASAIRAALYPADTEYYYFYSVSSSVTLYAKTYPEHLENIQRGEGGTADEQ